MKDKNNKLPPLGKVFWALILAVPALWTGHLVRLYGVDIPYWDQWNGTCPLFERMEEGSLRLADFFAFHNEHRIFFPKLVMFGLAKLTHWNIRAELLAIWILALACALSLWRLARATGWSRANTGYWLLLATNILLFTPLEQENWLWGFQIGFLLPPACVTACLWIAVSLRFPLNFLFTMALSTICTFSGASGFACWFLVLPLLLLPDGRIRWRDRRGWWQVWLLGCVATTFLYFRGYETPAHHPSLMGALSNPLPAFQYFCAYLGGPFAHGTAFNAATVAQPVGAVLLLAVMAAAVYLWRRRRDAKFLSQTLPWLMLTLFALLNAALTALGRQSFGVNQALNSRYLAFSVLLPIGLVFLAPLIFNHWRTQAVPAQKTVTVGMVLSSLGAVLVLLHGLGSLRNLETWKWAQHHRLRAKALVHLINVVDDPEALGRYVHAIVPPLKDRANLLNRLGYLRPGLVQTNLVRLIAGANPLAPARYGEIQQAGKPAEGQFGMAGWSVLPDKARPADAVLLTYDNAAGDSVIFALAEVGVQRPDVAAGLQEPGYLHAGWVKTFNTSRLPAGALSLRAWAFDAETCRAYPIQGVAPSQR